MVDELWNNQTNRKQNLTIVTKNKQNNSKSNQRSNKNEQTFVSLYSICMQILHKKYMFSRMQTQQSTYVCILYMYVEIVAYSVQCMLYLVHVHYNSCDN